MAFDGDKIERVVLNLLSNALKFTNNGGQIFVNITDNQDTVEISVRDTGIGIPEDKKELIFGRFMQVDKTFRRNREGSGIGLSLVKSFVEIHGGNIKLKSEINQGSEFTVILPVIKVKETNKAEELKGDMIDRVNMELSDIYSDTFN
jgi:signal transduction histidine kinase